MIKIIIVEDDVKLNNLIKTVLERNGYNVDSAYDPYEALSKMEKVGYHLIISDIMMPKMDGIEFSKAIRENDKDIPIEIFDETNYYQKLFELIEFMKQEKFVSEDALKNIRISRHLYDFDEHMNDLIKKRRR